ncbi:MAG TPA: hypothetical protein VFQ30_16945 [Ktedonobacteraceae bacterium]|nr:hypothetical protein [Ktedonobacteraceae bacterium]
MRFAPVALVLVVGAAVVLWFGNTLNSWVVGGLIGGLAALLISIPISLTLFFHLSQRHEEKLRAQEELSFAQEYPVYQDQVVDAYETSGYQLPEAQQWYEDESRYGYQVPVERRLPAPAPQRSPASTARPPAAHRQPTGQMTTGRTPAVRRQPQSEQEYYPGFPGYQERSYRSKHQTAALRAAIDEASQQNGRPGRVSGNPTRKFQVARPTVPIESADYTEYRTTRNAARPNAGQNRPRRADDGTSNHYGSGTAQHRSMPTPAESSGTRSQRRNNPRNADPQTEYLRPYQQTGQLRRQQTGSMSKQQTDQLRQQTGQIVRNPRIDEQRRNPETITGDLGIPMVRRAPYMYEDDALRDEFARMIDPPSVRRSSRREAERFYEEQD